MLSQSPSMLAIETPPSLKDLALSVIKEAILSHRFVKLDLGFHRRLTAMTGNKFLIDSLETIWDLVDWIGTERFHLKDGAKHALAEHRVIFNCLKDGDVAKALDALEHHLKLTEAECIAAIQSRKLYA
jgi:DNA-binding FadR family transcriptional regulator